MTKTLLLVVFITAAGILGAATTTVSATCTVNGIDSPPTLTPGAANCSVIIDDRTALSAEATAEPLIVTARATDFLDPHTPLNLLARASATYESDYLLTIHGGSGIGRASPCFRMQRTFENASATAQFGPFTSFDSSFDCRQAFGVLLPFDVPTLFHVRLSASAVGTLSAPSEQQGGSSSAGLGLILVNDLLGNPVPNSTYTLTEVDSTIPEQEDLFLYLLWSDRWSTFGDSFAGGKGPMQSSQIFGAV